MLNLFKRRPVNRRALLEIRASVAVRYKTRILNADGSVFSERPFKNNLILDQGLNNVATNVWTRMFLQCAVGTSTDPVKRDSAATTFYRTGTTVTASANFFEAADVGRLLKFDTGEEMYITVFTDTQNVTVNTSGTLGASEGTIWYVNQTSLQTESTRTATTSGGGALNLSTFSVDTWTHQRQFLFPAVGSPVTYREIGWSHTVGPGNLFGRDLIPGVGDSLMTGQQYQVIVQLIVKYTPNNIQTQANVGSGSFDTSGTWSWQYVGVNAVSTLAQDAICAMDPGGDGFTQRVVLLTQAITLLTAMTDSVGAPVSSAGFGASTSRSVYISGTFFRDITGTFDVTEAVSTGLTGITWGSRSGGGTQPDILSPMPFVVKFTTAQTKDSLHTVTIVLRLSWGRTLVN